MDLRFLILQKARAEEYSAMNNELFRIPPIIQPSCISQRVKE